MKKLIIVFSMLFVSVCVAQTSTKEQIEKNKQSIIVNEKSIKEQQDLLDKQQKHIKQLQDSLQKAKFDSVLANQTYQTAKSVFELKDGLFNTFVAVIVGLLSIIGFNFFNMRRDLKKHVKETKEMHDKKIADIFNQRENLVKDLLMKFSKESILLKESKLLIINKTGTFIDKHFVTILDRFKVTPTIIDTTDFKKYTHHDKDETFDIVSIKDFDAVILDNVGATQNAINWNFNTIDVDKKIKELKNELEKEKEEERVIEIRKNINKLMNKNSRLLKIRLVDLANNVGKNGNVFLYFGDARSDGKFSTEIAPNNSHLISFATKPSTLFTNLIELLEYKRLIS